MNCVFCAGKEIDCGRLETLPTCEDCAKAYRQGEDDAWNETLHMKSMNLREVYKELSGEDQAYNLGVKNSLRAIKHEMNYRE